MSPISSDTITFSKEYRAPFIVLEGMDGSGISTQTALLANALRNEAIKVYVTKEPSDGPVGAMIRLFLSKRLAPPEGGSSSRAHAEMLALYFAADRKDHYQNVILPKLNQGITVLCDRFHLSTYAYQGVEVGDDEWLHAINAKVQRPDVTIYLNIEPRICLERIRRRQWHFELFETEASLGRVQRAYERAIAHLKKQGEKIEIVDGSQSVEAVHAAILGIVRKATGNEAMASAPT